MRKPRKVGKSILGHADSKLRIFLVPFVNYASLTSLFFGGRGPFNLRTIACFFRRLLRACVQVNFTRTSDGSLVNRSFTRGSVVFDRVVTSVQVSVCNREGTMVLPLPKGRHHPRRRILPNLTVATHHHVGAITTRLTVSTILAEHVRTNRSLVTLFASPTVNVKGTVTLLRMFVGVSRFVHVQDSGKCFFVRLVGFFLVRSRTITSVSDLSVLLFVRFVRTFPRGRRSLVRVLTLQPLDRNMLWVGDATMITGVHGTVSNVSRARRFVPRVIVCNLQSGTAGATATRVNRHFVWDVRNRRLLYGNLRRLLSRFVTVLLGGHFVYERFRRCAHVVPAVTPVFLTMLVYHLRRSPRVRRSHRIISGASLPRPHLANVNVLWVFGVPRRSSGASPTVSEGFNDNGSVQSTLSRAFSSGAIHSLTFFGSDPFNLFVLFPLSVPTGDLVNFPSRTFFVFWTMVVRRDLAGTDGAPFSIFPRRFSVQVAGRNLARFPRSARVELPSQFRFVRTRENDRCQRWTLTIPYHFPCVVTTTR